MANIVKSLKVKYGYSHRIHRAKKNQKRKRMGSEEGKSIKYQRLLKKI